MKKNNNRTAVPLSPNADKLKREGYTVMPSMILGEGASELYSQGAMNFAYTGGVNTSSRTGESMSHIPGGFTSAGSEQPVLSDNIGTPGKGYIAWGAGNNLPNFISILNSMLPYTAAAIKFNVDTACGIGIRPMYRTSSGVAGQFAETEIPFELAGKAILQRIQALQKEEYNFIKDEHPTDSARKLLLDSIMSNYSEQIAALKKDYEVWERTNNAVRRFLKRTNTTLLNHNLFGDLISFGCCFPEIRLSQGGKRQELNSQWKPTIESVGWRNALTCRLERYDENNVSRHVYLSNYWLNTNEQHGADLTIDALPAIDPSCPASDLTSTVRRFRMKATFDTEEENRNITKRKCRHILPVTYTTPGRSYYSLPSYWSIYNDIYQFASTIIRDRAIRKRNENMFGYVIYVHSDYLDRLVDQLDASATEDDKKRIKAEEIDKIKRFLRDKANNGASMAACMFTGNDGQEHDAFRIEQVSMANKNAAEADKTEIADISSIILFALECHPDLIGSTPGGASSKGGTYQREMLQIKQAKLAPTQQMVIEIYNLVRDFNEWDPHLCWHIVQRSLTTLDRSHSGTIDE